ncbi:recombinase family protein [Methylobacterium persicinum]
MMKALAPGDLIIMPAADRLARDPIDLVVLAREMQQAGAALRSLAEPYIDTAGDFA